ncbi:MAG: mechanosensitive ion channel domain-containing protein [Pseudomonadota bacterium]
MDFVDILIDRARQIPNLIIEFAPGVLLALAIFIIGRGIVRRISTATVTASARVSNIDETLARFFGSVVLAAGTIAVVIASLSAMNINLAFLATIIASLFIALGFALQDSLGDVASGIVLAVFRPYKVGEEVEIAGQNGVVQELGLFATRMVTRDNVELVISNSDALGNTIKNFYAYGERRLDMKFGIGYGSDIGTAIRALTSVADGDDRILRDPAPWAKVVELGNSAVVLELRIWCDADDHRKVKMDLSRRVKEVFDAAGIEIPYEYQVVLTKPAVTHA